MTDVWIEPESPPDPCDDCKFYSCYICIGDEAHREFCSLTCSTSPNKCDRHKKKR